MKHWSLKLIYKIFSGVLVVIWQILKTAHFVNTFYYTISAKSSASNIEKPSGHSLITSNWQMTGDLPTPLTKQSLVTDDHLVDLKH